MVRVRVDHPGGFSHEGTLYPDGETVDVPEHIAERYPTTLEPIEDDDADPELERFEDDDSEDDVEVCGTPLTSGGTCDRPAASCPYHSDDTASET
jgi:hypothetical protein